MRSLSKHDRTINSDIIEFTETQIHPSNSTSRIIELLNFFNIKLKNNKDEFLVLAFGCKTDVVVVDKLDTNQILIFTSYKHGFSDRMFVLMLVCRKQSMQMLEFFRSCNIYSQQISLVTSVMIQKHLKIEF